MKHKRHIKLLCTKSPQDLSDVTRGKDIPGTARARVCTIDWDVSEGRGVRLTTLMACAMDSVLTKVSARVVFFLFLYTRMRVLEQDW